ncbi:MAG: hypothetical protein WBH20_15930 [Oceanisphaera sp.]|uniref:hypothetical protein n=1 Tax=Oceanisphaera sp. TaxID=1929979 RepID=UPI003C727365
MKQAREQVVAGSKGHQDITEAIQHGRAWIKDGLRYRPTHARREGRYIVIDLERIDG